MAQRMTISLRKNHRQAHKATETTLIWFTLPTPSVWPEHQIFLWLYFSLSLIRGNNSCYVYTYRRGIKVIELRRVPLERLHSFLRRIVNYSVVTDSRPPLQLHNTPSEAKLEGLNYLNVPSFNKYFWALAMCQVLYKDIGNIWPARQT